MTNNQDEAESEIFTQFAHEVWEGNVAKHVIRAVHQGSGIGELYKAQRYLSWLIEARIKVSEENRDWGLTMDSIGGMFLS